MIEMICIDDNYSTTRLLTREHPVMDNQPENKLDIMSFLPEGEDRQGEGGLRSQGYFKCNSSDKPLITVITAVYNGCDYLEEAMQSVFKQSYDNVEYIIIDGASIDGTKELLIKNQSYIDYWVSEKDDGIYNAWNKALSLANGEWLYFLGADDYFWDEHVLAKLIPQLTIIPSNTCVAYGQVMLLNEQAQSLHVVGKPWAVIKDRFKQIMCIPHQGVMHRRSLFDKYGGFDESFQITGDYELLLRDLKGSDAIFIPNLIVAGMRQGTGVSSGSENSLIIMTECWRAQKKHGARVPGLIWLGVTIRVYIRLILWKVLGEKKARKVLDYYRTIVKLPLYWTKT